MATEDKKKKEKNSLVNNITVGYGQSEIVQRHGEASSQILQAYTGRRYDSAGNDLNHQGRSLKQISKYKADNPKYAEQNMKQQSGFAAELLEESKRNQEAILNRSDVRSRTTDGIGRTNDTQYDLVDVDKNGNISNPSQMKFLGVDKKGRYNVIEKLAKDQSWDRYDHPIDVPKDQYAAAKKYANQEADKLLEQAKALREQGKIDLALEKEELAKRYRNAGKRIRPSNVTEKEALEARKHLKKYMAKEVVSNAHRAGKEAATGAMLVSGCVSLGQSICGVCTGDMTVEEAAETVVVTTAKAGVTAYTVGSVGSTIKSFMHTSKSEVIRKLGNTGLPTAIVTSTIEIGSVIKAYANGEVTEGEAFARLGKSGVGSLASSWGAAVGTVLCPGIGTIVGSMVGYMISSAIYDTCLQVFVEADLAYENYIRTKELCEAARESMRQQRIKFEAFTEEFLKNRENTFRKSIGLLMTSIEEVENDEFLEALEMIANEFGRELQFKSLNEFDEFMSSQDTTLII